jgi:hypothetical protein
MDTCFDVGSIDGLIDFPGDDAVAAGIASVATVVPYAFGPIEFAADDELERSWWALQLGSTALACRS